jgi:hypothetical protein
MRHRLRALPRVRSIAATSLALVAFATTAHAQNAEAEALFDEGNRLMTAGQLAQACDAFEASNKVETRAGTLLRLGECREQNHQLASAWSAYKDALVRAKDARKHDFAVGRIAALEPKLSHLTVSVAAGSQVDGLAITRNGKALDPVLWNRAIPVDGGEYAIAAQAPGRKEWHTTASVPADGGKIVIEVPPLENAAKPSTPANPQPVTAKPGVESRSTAPVAAPSRMWTGSRKAAVGVGAGAVVALGVGIGMGVVAKHKQSQATTDCPDPAIPCINAVQANALAHSGHQLAIGADVAFAVAGAAAIGATVMWATGGAKESARGVSVAPSLGGVVVMGRF